MLQAGFGCNQNIKIRCTRLHNVSKVCTLYEGLLIIIFFQTSESKHLNTVINLNYQEELLLFVFILCPVVKAASGARGGSTALATKTVV